MATIRRFEDLEIWQLARKLCNVIYSYIKNEGFSKDYKLVNQINGSSGSVMDNIAEGFDRGGRKEFISFLGISKGSCGEVKSQVYRAHDRKYISQEEFQAAYELADLINKKIHGLTMYLNASEMKGNRYQSRAEEPESAFAQFQIDLADEFFKP